MGRNIMFDFKTDKQGQKTEFSIMFMTREHVQIIHQALQNQKKSMFPIIEHFTENQTDTTEPFREELTNQYLSINELIEAYKRDINE